MCGRYTQTSAFDELALRFGITVEDEDREDLTPRYNTAPSLSVPVVVATAGGRRLLMARWGFRPAWMKGSSAAPINAKAETLATSRMFQDSFKRGRWLLRVEGRAGAEAQAALLREGQGRPLRVRRTLDASGRPGPSANLHHHHHRAERSARGDPQPDARDT